MEAYKFENFVKDHEGQLLASGVPAIFWETLHEKLKAETYDAGAFFKMSRVISDEQKGSSSWRVETVSQRMSASDGNNIFLIDHAWSFELREMRLVLDQHPNLLDRMCGLMDITDAENKETKMTEVSKRIWKYANSYQVRTPSPEDPEGSCPQTVWYINDEFGSRIQHSDNPTAVCIPLLYLPRSICYSVLWLIKSLDPNAELTRDYISHIKDSEMRPYHLLPWIDRDFSDKSSEHVTLDENFFMSHRMAETLPRQDFEPTLPLGRKVRVYAEMSQIRNNLTDERYELVDDPSQADIRWYFSHFKDFETFSKEVPNTLINQFPFEMVITVKDLLAALAAESDNGGLDWYPMTYNLVKELPQFVAEFQRREKTNEPNYWILKPWNLGRGAGIQITDSLTRVIRGVNAVPLIASRYIHQPVLFYRDDLDAHVKFDVRYMLMVRSIKPLRCYAYNVFWLRFANKAFDLGDFDDYEKHFTVMNYREESELKQINCEEFGPMFDKQYPEYPWSKVEADIHEMLRNMMRAVTKNPSPKGICHSPQSRGMYAVDLVLEWVDNDGVRKIRPMVCEANFQPDCERACKYHPFYFNDIFNTLFLDEPNHVTSLFD